MDTILKIENVSKSYTGHKALDDVSLEIPRGAVYGLLGPNGAGKTTLIRIITRITMADAGRVLLDGKPLTAEDVFHIGYMPEERGLYKKMRVGEQAIFFARLKGLDSREAERRLRAWFKRLNIAEWWDRKVEDLSKGMAQKVQFIATVVHEPKLLIFDEPFSGFDPINANLLKEEILGLRDRGATVIFSTHNMASVEEICDHITLINKSRNILSGSVEEIRRTAGGNNFEVLYRASEEEFLAALGNLATRTTESRGTVGGYTQTRIHIPNDEDVRGVIAALNDRCNLRSLNEVIPSMNDIFIRTVNGTL
ncbi:MAG: ATP-binding cassette domain-containing protein [Alistipes sp.]|jgi:ABC-2 type transport system ATP-binding protein|nr:ATP-binding cassette domain-containing protein [Alistipes sp.]MBQ5924678.1 ATP-binding cassette domain-containing protein [Alistipes sp.]MEE1147969.1 ATP-binding cassette domain-containing protein [Alistipes sp.]